MIWFLLLFLFRSFIYQVQIKTESRSYVHCTLAYKTFNKMDNEFDEVNILLDLLQEEEKFIINIVFEIVILAFAANINRLWELYLVIFFSLFK